MANIFKNLMKRLGFERYYAQAGNWGGIILQIMASLYPENIIGLHSSICSVTSPLQSMKWFIGSYFPSLIGIPKDQEYYLYPISEHIQTIILETGYAHLHATKPDTVGKLYFQI